MVLKLFFPNLMCLFSAEPFAGAHCHSGIRPSGPSGSVHPPLKAVRSVNDSPKRESLNMHLLTQLSPHFANHEKQRDFK